MVKVNGENIDINKETTIAEYLKETGYKAEQVAVEHNDEIIPKNKYESTYIKDGDVIEIVTFMGGGSH